MRWWRYVPLRVLLYFANPFLSELARKGISKVKLPTLWENVKYVVSPGRRSGPILNETKFSFTRFLKILDHGHRYFWKYGSVVADNRKLWFSFFYWFWSLIECHWYYFFPKKLIKIQKLRSHQAIFLWISTFYLVILTIFSPGRQYFWVMTSNLRHNNANWDFFL